MGKHKTKDGETAASKTQDGCWDNQRDHSQNQEARDAALAQTIAEAVAREMAKAHAHYHTILNETGATTLPTSLKVSSGSHDFKVMDPFDWTKDKSIYQRWQIWSGKARLTLDAMEGDSEKTKISYFHHWINEVQRSFYWFLPCLDLLPVSLFCIQFPGFLVPRCALLFGEYL